jgi:hypothetical protein
LNTVHIYYRKGNTQELTLTVTSCDLELECEGLLEEEEFNGSMEPEEVRPCSLIPEEVRFLGPCSLKR